MYSYIFVFLLNCFFSSVGGVGGIKRHAEDSKEVPSEKKNLPLVAKNHNLKTNTENHPPQTEMPNNIRDNLTPSLNIQKSAPEKHIVATPARQTGTDCQKSPGPKCVPAPITPLGARSPQPHRDAEVSIQLSLDYSASEWFGLILVLKMNGSVMIWKLIFYLI